MKVLQLIAYSCPTPVGSGAKGDRLLAEVCVEKGAVVVRSSDVDVKAEIELFIRQALERDPYSFAVIKASWISGGVCNDRRPGSDREAVWGLLVVWKTCRLRSHRSGYVPLRSLNRESTPRPTTVSTICCLTISLGRDADG